MLVSHRKCSVLQCTYNIIIVGIYNKNNIVIDKRHYIQILLYYLLDGPTIVFRVAKM